MSIQERLTQFLKDSSGWERKSIGLQGVFLLKLPGSKAGTWKECIAIEINPVNPSTGFPTKKVKICGPTNFPLDRHN